MDAILYFPWVVKAFSRFKGLSLFLEQFRKKCIYVVVKKIIAHIQKKTQAQKRFEKSLDYHFELFLT